PGAGVSRCSARGGSLSLSGRAPPHRAGSRTDGRPHADARSAGQSPTARAAYSGISSATLRPHVVHARERLLAARFLYKWSGARLADVDPMIRIVRLMLPVVFTAVLTAANSIPAHDLALELDP